MSVLKRLRMILASNITAKMEKMREPEKEVNQYIREMELDLREIKGETEASIASKNRMKRKLQECQEEINKMERFAIKALENGDEEKARNFLEKKLSLKPQKQEYEKQYELASIKVEQMKLAQDKLTQDLVELSNQRDVILGKLAVAKSIQLKNEIGTSQSNVRLSLFDQLEEQANRALAEAEALAELRKGLDNDLEKLVPQYDNSINVEKELAELKAKKN